jgi:tetratricopeptide (TPR) repeat protein
MSEMTRNIFPDAWRSLDSLSIATAPIRFKGALSASAENTLTRLRGIQGGLSELDPSKLIGCYNNAGLAFYQQGRADRAREVSEAALALCETGWKTSGWPVWCGCMLGPYVNVAKLESVGGDARAALEGYRAYYLYLRCGADLCIGGATLTQDMLESFSQFNSELKALRSGAAAVYLADSAKAFLVEGDFGQLFEFVERAGADATLAQSSRRHAYVISELRARALEGLGREEEALVEYRALVEQIPKNLPGPLALWAAVARLTARVESNRDALRVLENAEATLAALPQTAELAVGRYYAQFAFALERLSLGDAEGAYHGARKALDAVASVNHTVGAMRARVLSRLAASIAGAPDRDAPEHDLAACEAEINSSLYGFERAAALIHLARAESVCNNGAGHARRLLWEAGSLLAWLDHCKFKAPFGLNIPPSLETLTKSMPYDSILADPSLDELYGALMDYANSSICALS